MHYPVEVAARPRRRRVSLRLQRIQFAHLALLGHFVILRYPISLCNPSWPWAMANARFALRRFVRGAKRSEEGTATKRRTAVRWGSVLTLRLPPSPFLPSLDASIWRACLRRHVGNRFISSCLGIDLGYLYNLWANPMF